VPRRRPWQHCLGATSSPVGPERRSPRSASDGRNGALMWPERSDVKEVAVIKAGLGPHMATGRPQQSPQPKGALSSKVNGGKFGKERIFR